VTKQEDDLHRLEIMKRDEKQRKFKRDQLFEEKVHTIFDPHSLNANAYNKMDGEMQCRVYDV